MGSLSARVLLGVRYLWKARVLGLWANTVIVTVSQGVGRFILVKLTAPPRLLRISFDEHIAPVGIFAPQMILSSRLCCSNVLRGANAGIEELMMIQAFIQSSRIDCKRRFRHLRSAVARISTQKSSIRPFSCHQIVQIPCPSRYIF